ncbi:MAG: lipopolysaccharide heptosyltransferase II [Candidatus Omnitrophica bacterium]|nr:lipopolysaccharide heptosyltransferase II [Candidatus Omnitrophota bacterium]
MSRIIIFNVNWLGDVLFSTAAIRNIRRNFPDSYIACVIPSRCHHILKGNPHLDEIIIFDEKDKRSGVIEKINFIRSLKEKKFDMAFLLHRSFTRALICRLAGIPVRHGYFTKKRGFLLSKKIPLPKKDSLHRIDFYLNLIKGAGFKVGDRFLEFFLEDSDVKFVDDFLKKNSIGQDDFTVVLNPGGNWMLKRWPKEYWAELADRLIGGFGAKVIITGSPADMPLVAAIKKLMKNAPVITCGVFNIKHLGALCRKAKVFVTADTGPLHIANAVGAKKIIALFGPTSVQVTGPYPLDNVVVLQKDVGCIIPCYQVNCKDNRCMKAILPREVIEEIIKI